MCQWKLLKTNHNSVDENIEARLLQLKFFRKTWCSEEPTDQTEPVTEAPSDVLKTAKPKRKAKVVEEVPTYTTKEEADKFNDWYIQKIGANTNTFADALKVEVQATKVEHDETPTPVSGAFMDEEVDHDHTKKLPSPHTRNLLEESTNVITNPNMENMFVLLFAILKLINFSCPKLSYVPAVFPTQSHSYPDPSVHSYAPLPSSASGSIMGPMEMRLTRTSRSQVATSHVTEGYGSWLSETIWGILQRGKVGAGLRLIEAGEMLLA